MSKSNGKKKQILLVDDDRSVSQMLTMLLETRGYNVHTAFSGTEALQKASETTDLILLDLILPDEEGFETCRKLKEQARTANVPIIILSARVLSGDIVEGLYLGADDYLTKPFEYEELVARMEAIMRRGAFFEGGPANINKKDDELVRELRRIVTEGRIVPYYQPIYLLKPFKLFGLEALCRPQTDTVLANPELLFKLAIKYGCYQDLEMLSWKKAVDYAADFITTEYLFLNCNPYLVEGPKFLTITSLFENSKLNTANVILEITERSEVANFKEFYSQLGKFREFGFKFAVDDVGGGYASLESIVETKPEVVKIDRNIIQNLENDPYKRSIVKFVVAFCRENNIFSVAEGIETKESLHNIMELGIDAAQGYYLSKPKPEIDIKEFNNKIHSMV
ncbi:MAG: EAL domain-containing protein [Candidatus Omnitrophica bacterium]|nr:EAL domain-containing protein [Candidatus Omnitrophota bacterium]